MIRTLGILTVVGSIVLASGCTTREKTIGGAVAGGLGGAVLGDAVAGTGGAIVGGVGGAVAGGAIARRM